MRSLAVLYLLLHLVSCHPHKKLTETEIAKLKSEHTERLKMIRLGFDPYYKHVPDSMKRWIKVFSNVLADDQENRILNLQPTKEEWKEQNKLDSQNLRIVSEFLDMHGWPAKYDAGFIAQRAVGIVIQHSSMQVQEKYYPLLVKTFRRDSSLFEILALLEDRINMRNKRPQYYGTQVISVDGKAVLYPVVNVDSIEFYRKQLGRFMPFDKYLGMLEVDWNPVEYKKKLPALKQKLKVSDSLGIHYIFQK